MSIYTKTGDKGETSLFGGKRLSKSNLRVEAYGTVDELTSFLGLLIVKLVNPEEQLFFTDVQRDLYDIMAVLSGAKHIKNDFGKKTKIFEQYIDRIESELPPLHNFILPGGTELSSLFHIVRTVCRRGERAVVRLMESQNLKTESEKQILMYLNRLSDLFFDFARCYNKESEKKL